MLIVPIILLTTSSEFLAARHIFIAIAGIYSAIRLIRSEATMASLGIHRAKFFSALQNIALPSFVLIIGTFLVFYFLPFEYLKLLTGYDPLPVIPFSERILAYVFLSAPIQELIFRGYITWRIAQVFSSTRIIEAISVGIFTIVHLPFHSPLILVVTLIMGIIYIKNYSKYQNLYAPAISHALVGACLIIVRNAWFPY